MHGVNPRIWGPSGWMLLHRMSFCFHNVHEAKQFFMSLRYILPCPKCRESYTTHISAIPLPTRKCDIPMWVYRIHNRVNASTGDTETPPSFTDVVNKYTSCDVHPEEWLFLRAIADTHPGKKSITDVYASNLATFLQYWKNCSGNTSSLPDVTSKQKLKEWIQHHKTTRLPKIRSCDRNMCSI